MPPIEDKQDRAFDLVLEASWEAGQQADPITTEEIVEWISAGRPVADLVKLDRTEAREKLGLTADLF